MKRSIDQARKKRKMRVRKKIISAAQRPRLSIFRSTKHIYAQIIDDKKRVTIVQANDSEILKTKKGKETTKVTKTDMAIQVGALIAQRAIKANISKVAFDRGSYRYHGRIKALAAEARKNGLIF